jgi:hypothetical protein
MNWTAFRRRMRLALIGPRAPRHPGGFHGPVVVLGSAPQNTKPAGFDDSFSVLTVNASQANLDAWGVEKPAATFIHFYNIEGDSENARAVRKVLDGRATGELYVLRWTLGEEALLQSVKAMNYRYDHLHSLSKYHRMAMHLEVMRYFNNEDDNELKFSNGITALFYALLSGAPAVILSGINPASSGNFYGDLERKRLHANTDMRILNELKARGLPIYTADADVAAATGLDLWDTKPKIDKNSSRVSGRG